MASPCLAVFPIQTRPLLTLSKPTTTSSGLRWAPKMAGPQVSLLFSSGGWKLWSLWGECTRDCGGGLQTRTRTCLPTPGVEGGGCEGVLEEGRLCNRKACGREWAGQGWG